MHHILPRTMELIPSVASKVAGLQQMSSDLLAHISSGQSPADDADTGKFEEALSQLLDVDIGYAERNAVTNLCLCFLGALLLSFLRGYFSRSPES